MADYKRRANPKKKNRGHTSCSIWFFAGIVAGAFVVGLLWLKLGGDLSNAPVPGVTKPTTSPKSNTPKPTFEFYTILPEMEVVIPDEELMVPEDPEPARSQPETPTPTVKDGTAYILQMGSFRKYGDADRMKAKLALIGIEAEIQKVSINNRDTFHRVRSGPYSTQQQLNAVRRLANENNIASLVIKLKK
ncbi:MAG: SPOR domain-containing protein [Candidatus Thiodiazotropha sp. (ex Monitilora ramsayi)]|nr:SPOR domain-containing protein [Candidatus Thiodiazotropha sp. (ex Monitilora ramsayi)]